MEYGSRTFRHHYIISGFISRYCQYLLPNEVIFLSSDRFETKIIEKQIFEYSVALPYYGKSKWEYNKYGVL